MARIRSIHPGIWTDEAFVSVSQGARLLFIGLLNECDDQGAFRWNPVTLKVRLAPMDSVDIAALLTELARVNLIRRYTVERVAYGAVRNFREWQRPKKPNSVYPMPDELRTYAGPKSSGSEPGSDNSEVNGELWGDEGARGSEPTITITRQSGEPAAHDGVAVPSDKPPGGEKPPQGGKEEGGKGRKKDSVLRTDAAGAAPLSIRDALWRDGVPIVQRLIGKSDAQARSFLGGLVKRSLDDCARVYAALREAESLRPVDPSAWLAKACTPLDQRGQPDLPVIASDANPRAVPVTPLSGGF